MDDQHSNQANTDGEAHSDTTDRDEEDAGTKKNLYHMYIKPLWDDLRSHEKISAFLTTLILIATAANVTVTLVYLIFFILNSNATAEQAKQLVYAVGIQAKAAQDFAEAAQESAKAARDSADIAHQTFLGEQRPIIWLVDLGGPQFVAKGETGQVLWTFSLMNYGKTPTKEMHTVTYMKVGTEPFQPSYGPTHGVHDGPPEPPGRIGDHYTVVSHPGITVEQFKRLLQETSLDSISIRVQITYSDLYGGNYETGFGLVRLNTGDIAYRHKENYIK